MLGQTQTTFKFFSHLKVLYHWIEESISRIAQTTTFLRIIHPGQTLKMIKFFSETSNVFDHWIEDLRFTYFTESFSENLIEPREYWDKAAFFYLQILGFKTQDYKKMIILKS